ncbi:MAG TPA: metalloregulator ArsR/SmtB family transcription factor [Saprospiraceae bacterium]|nr:metalloregulator ArsR/SmtB family transcription factor [Saprospiraceae bacterium]
MMKDNRDMKFLEEATETLRAMAHPLRLLIIEMLHHRKAMTVTEIYEALGIEQAVASHHLRILKDKDVLSVRRDGKNSFYALAKEEFFHVFDVMQRVV